MKILLIRNSYTYNFGGAERFSVSLAQELAAVQIQSVVISRQPRLLEHAKATKVPYIRGWWWSMQTWSGKTLAIAPLYLLWQLALIAWYTQLIIRTKPDVVHPQSKDDFIAATIAGRMLGKRIIWTDHADLKYVYANHAIWYKNPVGKLVYACSKLAHTVTLVSHSEQKLIETALGHPLATNYQVIHNGIVDLAVTPQPRTPELEDAVVFCATSRLVIAKGIGELIVAFKQLCKPSYHLWLVGDGPDEAQFKKLAGDTPTIHFIGHSDTPLGYVAACNVLVHPSYHEGFSLSLVEAAMLGKPIIACNVGGNPELVDDRDGILVPAQEVEPLAAALETLGNNPELRKQLGAGARKNYEQNFNFTKIVKERFIPLYDQKN